jgi:hypothetical protein
MPNQLLESDFLTVDLSAVFRNQASIPNAASNVLGANEPTTTKQIKPANYDWSRDLKDRLDANRSMSPESRKSEYSIETQFFTEFFNNLFGSAELTKRALAVGDVLQKDIKILGFKKAKNPILAFLSVKYVQDNLLKTGLLNVNTYKVIHNAVAKSLMADSEFYKKNSYNIIYCRNFYTKSVTEMEELLKIQKMNLASNKYPYSAKTQDDNKRIFFYIKSIKEQDISRRKKDVVNFSGVLPAATQAATALNSLEFCRSITGWSDTDDTEASTNKSTSKGAKSSAALVKKLETPAQVFAALQYLSMATEIPEAKKALQHGKFKSLRAEDLVAATNYVAKLVPESVPSAEETKTLITAMLSRLDQDS